MLFHVEKSEGNEIPGISLPSDFSTWKSIPLSNFYNDSVLNQFLVVCEWVIQKIKSYKTNSHVQGANNGYLPNDLHVQGAKNGYLPNKDDFQSAYRMVGSPGQNIDKAF